MRGTVICLISLAQLALAALAEPQPHKIPLYRRTNDGIVKAAGNMLENGVLVGDIEIGTPPQKFTVAFDTNAGYSWVRGSRCKTENCLDRCTYYARRSETVVSTGQKFSIDYGDSCVDTHIYLDTVNFAGLTVENMPFGGAYRMSGFDHGFDGYLGLGQAVNFNHTKLYSTTGKLNRRDVLSSSAFVSNAYQQGSGLQSAQFGIYTTIAGGSNGFGESGVANPVGGGSEVSTPATQVPAPPAQASNSTVVATPSQANPPPAVATGETAPQQPATPSPAPVEGPPVTSGGFGFFKRTNKEEPAGYLVLGGVDTSIIKGDVEYIPLADTPDGSAKNWDVCIKDANFDGVLNIKQKPLALASISTTSNYITMPSDQADIFQELFGLKYYGSTKTYAVKCSEIKNLPTLKLTLENHIVELPPNYWTHEIDSKRDCCGTLIRRGDSERDWILGTSFSQAFYTTFDPENGRVGLAIKKGQKDDGLRVYKKSH